MTHSALANGEGVAIETTMAKREKLDPSRHKARVAARIWLKTHYGGHLNARDKRLARLFSNDSTVTNDLIHEAMGPVEVEFISRRWVNGRNVHPEPAWLNQK